LRGGAYLRRGLVVAGFQEPRLQAAVTLIMVFCES
jgi:hypothetical protein